MRETPVEPAVVVFADADDAGVARLVSRLAPRVPLAWWRFGLPEDSVSVHADQHGFRLEQPGAVLTSDDVRDASVVVYRRRLLQRRPLVTSALPAPEDRAFSEREWTSLIEGLLLAEERRSRATWLNAPSATLLADHKLALVLLTARAGLPVPPFSISTPVRYPPTPPAGLVTKAISADERIDDSRHFTTALLSEEDLRGLPGTRVPTPALLQHYVPTRVELRVYLALGQFLTLALTPSPDHVDIRHLPRRELAPRPYELPPDLGAALAGAARAFALEYCTFDIAIPAEGPPALLDVTPNGDWDHFESDEAPTVSAFLADAIAARAAQAAEDRS